MKIQSLEVNKLNNRFKYKLKFHDDINVITGNNGSGKTTILKLIWYLVSGNIERIFPEISFDYINFKTDVYEIILETYYKEKIKYFSINLKIGEKSQTKEVVNSGIRDGIYDVDDFNNQIIELTKSSIFLPTFRRIEGGFSVGKANSYMQDALRRFAMNISVYEHQFVTTISTDDLIHLLTSKYAEASDITNNLYISLSKSIEEKINFYNSNKNESKEILLLKATQLIEDINIEVSKNTIERDFVLKKFSILSSLINRIFKYDGIKITNSLILGNANAALSSENLSAGEKQMLSFLCYNAFFENTTIIIDEPEISLHVDWQRLLMPTLIEQDSHNQFIMATHSPFIYSKYPDKEIILDNKYE